MGQGIGDGAATTSRDLPAATGYEYDEWIEEGTDLGKGSPYLHDPCPRMTNNTVYFLA